MALSFAAASDRAPAGSERRRWATMVAVRVLGVRVARNEENRRLDRQPAGNSALHRTHRLATGGGIGRERRHFSQQRVRHWVSPLRMLRWPRPGCFAVGGAMPLSLSRSSRGWFEQRPRAADHRHRQCD